MANEHDDTLEYLAEWSRDVAKATTRAELKILIRHYLDTANNRRLPKAERQQARKRANALERYL